MTGLVLTDDVVAPERNVVLEEQNQRVANNPRARLGEQIAGRALSQSSLRPAGDRLAARDREAQPRGRARVLQALLHAEQRGPGGRRRRHRRRGQDARGRDLRQGRARVAEIGAAHAPAGAAADRRAPRHAADPRVTQPSLQRSYLVPSLATAQARRSRGARGAGATSSAAAPTAGSIARWWSRSDSRSAPAPGIRARRSTRRASASTARPQPASRCRQLEDGDRRGDRRRCSTRASPPTKLERAKNRLIADAVYAQDSQATLARWYGAALTTGSTVEQVLDLARPLRAVTRRAGDATRRGTGSTSAARSPAISIKDGAAREEKTIVSSDSRRIACAAADRRACGAAQPATRHQDRARHLARRHRGLAGARAVGAAGRARISPSSAAPTRTRPTSPASPTWSASLLDEGAGELDAQAFQERLEDNAIELGFSAGARPFPRLAAHAARPIWTRPSTCCGSRSPRRASTPSGRAHPRPDAGAAAARDHQPERASPAAAGGRRRFPDHPYGRPTERHARNRSPTITRRRPAGPMSRSVFARDTLKIAVGRRYRRRRRSASCSTACSARCRRRRRSRRCPTCRHAAARPSASSSISTCRRRWSASAAPGIARKDPDFIAGLRGQPHPRRRLVHLAALRRGAREARPRLRRLVPICCRCDHAACSWRRHRDPRRPRRRDAAS